jgi:hypothetical protein
LVETSTAIDAEAEVAPVADAVTVTLYGALSPVMVVVLLEPPHPAKLIARTSKQPPSNQMIRRRALRLVVGSSNSPGRIMANIQPAFLRWRLALLAVVAIVAVTVAGPGELTDVEDSEQVGPAGTTEHARVIVPTD